jgi:hypothetical protein
MGQKDSKSFTRLRERAYKNGSSRESVYETINIKYYKCLSVFLLYLSGLQIEYHQPTHVTPHHIVAQQLSRHQTRTAIT